MSDSRTAQRFGFGMKTGVADVPIHDAGIPPADTDAGNPPGIAFGLPANYPTASGEVYRGTSHRDETECSDFPSSDVRSQNETL
jgi:hypothetical protein